MAKIRKKRHKLVPVWLKALQIIFFVLAFILDLIYLTQDRRFNIIMATFSLSLYVLFSGFNLVYLLLNMRVLKTNNLILMALVLISTIVPLIYGLFFPIIKVVSSEMVLLYFFPCICIIYSLYLITKEEPKCQWDI